MQDAKDADILLSLHLKATMMKISDPILFGHGLKTFFKEAWDKHGDLLEEIGARANDGLASILDAIEKKLPKSKAAEIRQDFDKCYEDRPWICMVDSDKVSFGARLWCSFLQLLLFRELMMLFVLSQTMP